MDKNVTIYRKRHIPDEIVKLKDDEVVSCDDDLLVTFWKCIHPRNDIYRGASAYFLKKGYKVSKMYNSCGEVVYWYCDICSVECNHENNELLYEDLLLDVIIYNDGHVEVVDADEFAEALECGMITTEAAVAALRSLDELLRIIYSGEFKLLQREIEDRE